jgi:hypothetical protein
MSGAGDLLGTLGAVAPSALAGYTRGQARGLQFQIQQQRLNQQAQGLQDYRQQLIQLQQQGQQLKQQLAERQADQKELLRLTDLIQKKPHDLQQTGQLGPTLTQWSGLYQKVHPGEPLPSFFGEQYVPAGDRTASSPAQEAPLPPAPNVVQSWPAGADAPPFPPTPARTYRPQPAEPGTDAMSAPTRPASFVTAHLPAHFTGIPDIPLDEVKQSQIDAAKSLEGYRTKRSELTDEQIIRMKALENPQIDHLLAETALLHVQGQAVPARLRQFDERTDLLSKALGVNRDRLKEYIRNNFYNNQLGYDRATSEWDLRQSEIARNQAYVQQQAGSLPSAVWREAQPLFRGYYQTDPLTGRYMSDAQREPFRKGILALYQRHSLDARPFLHPGEPGYDPAYALGSSPTGASAETPSPPPGDTGATGPPEAFPPPPPPEGTGAAYGAPTGGPPALPAADGEMLVHTDPAELEQVEPGVQRWQYGSGGPGDPRFSAPPPLPKKQQFSGKELTDTNLWIIDGSFPKRLRTPKATLAQRERLLRAYWLLRGRPYRGP